MVNILEVMSRIYRENTWSEDVLFRVQDCIGPVYTWPLYIKHILRSKAFRYHERIKLTTFFFINGFRDHEGWLEFLVLKWQPKGIQKFVNKYNNSRINNKVRIKTFVID